MFAYYEYTDGGRFVDLVEIFDSYEEAESFGNDRFSGIVDWSEEGFEIHEVSSEEEARKKER